MRMYDIIEKKRDGKALECEEIAYFVNGYSNGDIPDYQVSALLMAIFLNGMDKEETAELTKQIANSGEVIDLSEISGIKVDKHSTGGVGDKTTLILAPIVASCGVPVVKMSGKGLGHTGGTIDKLESIPGFNTELSKEKFLKNIQEIGISISGQTGNLAPADKKLYALRDVTATVNNVSLIASSIMSKKIASGADKIVLDVKCGNGAFMKTFEESLELAKTMIDIGERVGRQTAAFITNMERPLGNAIGNSLEVIEAISVLKGKGPKDLREVSCTLAAKMLELAGKGTYIECMKMAYKSIETGKAVKKFAQMVKKQNGEVRFVEDTSLFRKADVVHEVYSDREGYVNSLMTERLGIASMILGAGRETTESSIDYTAGIILNKKNGMKVKKGELLATLYTNQSNKVREAEDILIGSFIISSGIIKEKPLILAYADSNGMKQY